MAWNNDLGKWGEDRAAEYLEQHGWYIRHRNWKKNHLELDIVAIDEDSSILIVVEVKTRATGTWGSPDDAITAQKKSNIIHAVNGYLFDYRLQHMDVRYDTINVIGTPETGYEIEHKEGSVDMIDQYEYYNHLRKTAKGRARHGNGKW